MSLNDLKYYLAHILFFYRIHYQMEIKRKSGFPNWWSDKHKMWVDLCFKMNDGGFISSSRHFKNKRKAFREFKKLSRLGVDCELSKVVPTLENVGAWFIPWESKDQKYFGKDLIEKKKGFEFNVFKKLEIVKRLKRARGKYYLSIEYRNENTFPVWWNEKYKIWTDDCCPGNLSSSKPCKSKRKAFKEFDKLTEMGIECRLDRHWFPLGYGDKRWIQEYHSKDQKWFGCKK